MGIQDVAQFDYSRQTWILFTKQSWMVFFHFSFIFICS